MTKIGARKLRFLGAGFFMGAIFQLPFLIAMKVTWAIIAQLSLCLLGVAMVVYSSRRLSLPKTRKILCLLDFHDESGKFIRTEFHLWWHYYECTSCRRCGKELSRCQAPLF